MKKNPTWLVLLLALAPLAQAAPTDSAPRPGAETRAWLRLQASGTASVSEAQPMPGEVADKVYQRYLNSFGQPIPATFQRDSFTGGGSSGGGSGGGSR